VNEIRGIQGMRGTAAFLIIIFHIGNYLPALINLAPFVSQFYSGVTFFFVISGFILTKKFMSDDYKIEGHKSKQMLVYYVRRIFRIWPLYYVGIILFAITPMHFYPSNSNGVPITWQSFFFLQNYSYSTYHIYPLWTLAIEELFYIILPLWVFLFRAKPRLSLICCATLSLLYLLSLQYVFITTPYYSWLDVQLPCYALAYALGTVAALGYTVKLHKSLVFLLAAIVFSYYTTEGAWFQPLVWAVVYYLVLCNFVNDVFFTNRITHWIGSLTYPLYLIGLPCLALATAVFATAQYYYWIPLTLALTIGGSYILHVLVEKPFIGLGRRVDGYVRKTKINNRGPRDYPQVEKTTAPAVAQQ
jgi:peptidoglycan/LPS O-acetylase OafA/YrhL